MLPESFELLQSLSEGKTYGEFCDSLDQENHADLRKDIFDTLSPNEGFTALSLAVKASDSNLAVYLLGYCNDRFPNKLYDMLTVSPPNEGSMHAFCYACGSNDERVVGTFIETAREVGDECLRKMLLAGRESEEGEVARAFWFSSGTLPYSGIGEMLLEAAESLQEDDQQTLTAMLKAGDKDWMGNLRKARALHFTLIRQDQFAESLLRRSLEIGTSDLLTTMLVDGFDGRESHRTYDLYAYFLDSAKYSSEIKTEVMIKLMSLIKEGHITRESLSDMGALQTVTDYFSALRCSDEGNESTRVEALKHLSPDLLLAEEQSQEKAVHSPLVTQRGASIAAPAGGIHSSLTLVFSSPQGGAAENYNDDIEMKPF